MNEKEKPKWYEKPHWESLKKEIESYRNGRVILSFQDGLPTYIELIEGQNKQVDLTR